MTLPKPSEPSNKSAAEAVTDFVKSCQSNSNLENETNSERSFQFEKLEERCVLSGNGLDLGVDTGVPVDTADSALVTTEAIPVNEFAAVQEVATEITHITLRVNGEEQVVNLNDPQLELAEGDVLEVVAIGVDSNATEGVFAVEGYINKINDESSASLIDYQDGRFSLIEDNLAASGGSGVVQGLDGSWTVESGWDRLTLSVLHYTESGAEVTARSLVGLEVGSADFAFDESAFEKLREANGQVGQEFEIFGRWFNDGSGKFHNYAEVDIYHESNLEQIIWAGALVGNPSGDTAVEGFFTNTRADDPFSEVFTPELEGGYLFRFYLDPEGIVAESNESNNQVDVKVFVSEADDNTTPTNDPTGFEQFVANEDLQLTFVNEQQFSFGFGVQNTTSEPVENWAVEILGADYKLDASQLTNSSAFDLTVTENADGTYNYLFVGTEPIAAFSGIPGGSIQWNGVNFGQAVSSTSFTVGEVLVNDDADNGENTGDQDADDEYVGFDQFQETEDVRLTFSNEQQFSFGFGVQNATSEPVENWAVEIIGADYQLDASQLTNSSAFELTVTENADGTYNYLFVGTEPLGAFGGIPGGNIQWNGVNFGQNVSSFSFTAGEVVVDSGVSALVVGNATPAAEVTSSNFKVQQVVSGNQAEEISLPVKASPEDFSHVRVSNLPDGAELTVGERTDGGNFDVPVDQLDQLAVVPASDADFKLAMTPVAGDVAYYNLTEAVKVEVASSQVQTEKVDFGLVTGYEAKMPYSPQLDGLGETDGQTVVFHGLPENVFLSAGERTDGGQWVLKADQLDDLRIGAKEVQDVSEFNEWGSYGHYDKHVVDVQLVSDSNETLSKDQFSFYVIQKDA